MLKKNKYFAILMFFKIKNQKYPTINNIYPYLAIRAKQYPPKQSHEYIKIQKRINPVKDILCLLACQNKTVYK
jgi:hypothetical protein